MIRTTLQIALATLLLVSCCPAPEQSPTPTPTPTPDPAPAPEEKSAPENWVYLYARLYESQSKATAEGQYLPNLREALADYQSTITIEEINNTEGEVEFIGVDFKIAAPAEKTESLETLLMDTFRISGAPYATQILVYTP